MKPVRVDKPKSRGKSYAGEGFTPCRSNRAGLVETRLRRGLRPAPGSPDCEF